MPEFESFNKIPRFFRECVITEKIDGTNAQIYVDYVVNVDDVSKAVAVVGDMVIFAGSRSRWIKEGDDNFGFATWVSKNVNELINLGPGRHYGEWWGQGIQRGYGLKEKRFSLFNTKRWTTDPTETGKTVLPSCVDLVPVLYSGLFSTLQVSYALDRLKFNGSVAAPGFMSPEGIICYHVAANSCFKATLEKDQEPKSKV